MGLSIFLKNIILKERKTWKIINLSSEKETHSIFDWLQSCHRLLLNISFILHILQIYDLYLYKSTVNSQYNNNTIQHIRCCEYYKLDATLQ